METLTKQAFDDMTTGAEVLSLDLNGEKVFRLPDGDIIKIFRTKRIITSTWIFPYSQRFKRNSVLLAELAIPSVEVKVVYRIETSGNQAVVYRELQGTSVRDCFLTDRSSPIGMGAKIGEFIAGLHSKGIYFRSLHLGNILLLQSGEFGLIDIADMQIRPWSLSVAKRARNFRHLLRYQNDADIFAQLDIAAIMEGYFRIAVLKPRNKTRFLRLLRKQLPWLYNHFPEL